MKGLLLALLILFAAPVSAQAASLYLSPSSGTYTAGKAFTVNVYVASADQAMNAVSATIAVDTSMFSVVSASSVGSIVNFWVQQPAVTSGNVAFEGVVLNPGYQGGGAKVASFVLMPKQAGSGAVSFSVASVLANDGQGSNILDSTSGGSYTIQAAATAPVPVPVKSEPKSEPAPAAPPAPTTEVAVPPQITDYDDSITYGDLAAFRGVTYENATVSFNIYKDGDLLTTEYTNSNSSGDFSMVIAKRLDPGTYEVRVQVETGEGLMSPESGAYQVVVKGDMMRLFSGLTASHLALIALGILAAIGLLAVLHALGWQRLFRLTRELHESRAESADVTHKVFALLKRDLAAHVRKLRSARENRALTEEELSFLDDFAEELDEAEAALKTGAKRSRARR